MSPDSVVGIATRYGMEGLGIESWWGEIFRTYSDGLRGPPSLLYNGYWVFPGCKGDRGVMLTTPPPSSAEVNELIYTSTQPVGPPESLTGLPLPFTRYSGRDYFAAMPVPVRLTVFIGVGATLWHF